LRRRPTVVLAAATAVALAVTGAVVIDARHDAEQQAAGEHPAIAESGPLRDARLANKPVRIDSQTSETTEVWARPDGQLEARISAAPVRVNRDGGWVPLDLGLRTDADGSVVPAAHPNGLRLSGARKPGTHELAAVGLGARRVAMQWTGALPAPVLDGDRATYVDARPGVDLVVRATRTGFEQSLIVKNRDAIDEVRTVVLPLTGPGAVSHKRDRVGTVTLQDRAGNTTSTVPAPAMWDKQTTELGSPARMTTIRTAVTGSARKLALKLTPDLGWLRDRRTVFPVTLDPTVTPISGTFDTFVQKGSNVDQSGVNDLRVGLLSLATPVVTRTFLTWNTTALTGKQITAATVKFWNYWSGSCDARPWEIWPTTEATASTRFDNQPQWIGETAAVTSTATRGGTDCPLVDGYLTVDKAAPFFQHFANAGAKKAFMGIKAADETDKTQFKQFRALDGGDAEVPTATVTYNAYPTITARATVPATTCVTGSARPLVNTLTPQLKATVADADNTLSVEFEWRAVGSTTPIGGITVAGVASGATATATVPAGAFTDGGRYEWRVKASDGVTGSSTWSAPCEMTTWITLPPVSGCENGVTSDYNGDGISDVAIGDPKATVGTTAGAGRVTVVYGGTGMVATLVQGSPEVGDFLEAGDEFGFALATYDANRDGCSDLVVTSPYEDSRTIVNSGAAALVLGSPQGLGKGPAPIWYDQQVTGFGDDPEAEDWFGYSVTAGQVANGQAYVAFGVPGEDVGAGIDAGLVHYLRGAANITLIAGAPVPGGPENDDRLGYSLASTPHHLAIGSPGEAIGEKTWAGAVQVFAHTIRSGVMEFQVTLGETTAQINDDIEVGDNFGASIAMAPYRPAGAPAGQAQSLLVVGAPGEDVDTVGDAGMVHRFALTATTATGIGKVTEQTLGIANGVEAGDYFGHQVRIVNTAPDEVATAATLQVAVGIPGEDIDGVADAGRVQVFGAATNPLAPTGGDLRRGSAAMPGALRAQELIGANIGASAERLYVASPFQAGTVFAYRWSDLAAGNRAPAVTYTAGQGGIPAGAAFGVGLG
jgi:hypothetical protein